MNDPQTNPRVYIVSGEALDKGITHGVWVDITGTAAEIEDAIIAMLEECPEGGNTWEVHDSEHIHGPLAETRYSPTTLAHMGQMAVRYGAAWLEIAFHLDNYDLSAEEFECSYVGEMDLVEYARQLLEDGALGNIPEAARPYIDVLSFASVLERWGGVVEAGSYVYRGIHSGWPTPRVRLERPRYLLEELEEGARVDDDERHWLGARSL